MGDLINKKTPREKSSEKCYKCNQLEWITYTTPRKIHRFIYSRKNLLVAGAISFFAYFTTFGQPEIIRRTLGAFIFSAACWVFEVFPLPITGLMAPMLLTLLGIVSPKEAFIPFSNPIIFLMIGGLVLGQSLKKHGLDKWIGYNLLIRSKGQIDRLVLYTILTTAFLSMWMANTVAIAVMLPIVLSIINSIPDELANLKKKLLLGITVSTSIGGMGMLTGSTPAMIAAALLGEMMDFGFMQWAYYGLPVCLLSLLATFLILKKIYPSPKVTLDIISALNKNENLGKFSGTQIKVIAVFTVTIILWFAGAQIETLLGLPASVSSVSIASIIGVLIMFGLDLLDLRDLQSIQWELIFLVGGGLLLGEAMSVSGTARKISSLISFYKDVIPPVLVLVIISGLSLLLTNFISNSATSAILIPVAIQSAEALGLNPVPFAVSVALSAVIAFITPVGVASTALVYSTGRVTRGDLIKTGVLTAIPTFLFSLFIVILLPVP